jgi:hypothetical protein
MLVLSVGKAWKMDVISNIGFPLFPVCMVVSG